MDDSVSISRLDDALRRVCDACTSTGRWPRSCRSVAPTVVALPKVAEAVEQAGLTGKIVVTGLSTPNDMREFVKRGTVKTVVLWNPVDLGYLAVYVAQASLAGTLNGNATLAKVPVGRLGTRSAVASLEDITANGPLTLKNMIVLGNPFRFTKENIDLFDF